LVGDLNLKNLISEMKHPQVSEAIDSETFAVIPTGSNEQHGPHLPLETDSKLVWEVVSRALDRLPEGVKAVCTPVIWMGYSTHHLDFSGTISLKPETYINMMFDLCESLVTHGIRKILIVNGHGGNEAALKVAARKVKDKHPEVLIAVTTYWDLVTEMSEWRDAGHGCHGCEFETDLMLALRPELVDMEAAPENPVKPRSRFYGRGFFEGTFVNVIENTAEISASGCCGLPTRASREAGEKLLKTLVDRMTEFLIDFNRWKIGDI